MKKIPAVCIYCGHTVMIAVPANVVNTRIDCKCDDAKQCAARRRLLGR